MPAASTAVACTNTSLPPPSGAIKPKPLEVLKNFTVPIVIGSSCSKLTAARMRGGRGSFVSGKEGNCLVQARNVRRAGFSGALHLGRDVSTMAATIRALADKGKIAAGRLATA